MQQLATVVVMKTVMLTHGVDAVTNVTAIEHRDNLYYTKIEKIKRKKPVKRVLSYYYYQNDSVTRP